MKWIGNTPLYLVGDDGNYSMTTDRNEEEEKYKEEITKRKNFKILARLNLTKSLPLEGKVSPFGDG